VPACPPDPNDQKKLEQYTQTYAYDDAGNLLQTRHSASRSWTRNITVADDSNRGFPDDSLKGSGQQISSSRPMLKRSPSISIAGVFYKKGDTRGREEYKNYKGPSLFGGTVASLTHRI
jgi:hypothetical protein